MMIVFVNIGGIAPFDKWLFAKQRIMLYRTTIVRELYDLAVQRLPRGQHNSGICYQS